MSPVASSVVLASVACALFATSCTLSAQVPEAPPDLPIERNNTNVFVQALKSGNASAAAAVLAPAIAEGTVRWLSMGASAFCVVQQCQCRWLWCFRNSTNCHRLGRWSCLLLRQQQMPIRQNTSALHCQRPGVQEHLCCGLAYAGRCSKPSAPCLFIARMHSSDSYRTCLR